MEKLTINTSLLRKEPALEVVPCVIARNKENMWFGTDDRYHCLLVYDKEQGDGLLVESEGYDYARYAQYIPQAKIIYENYCQS